MRPNASTTAENGRPDTLLSRLNRFGVDNGGATAVIGAILFPVVVGGLGLGAETGYWYLTQRKLQHIADVSAHAAGARLRADDSYEKIVAAARHVARESGYKGAPELDELEVNTPYTHEPFDDDKLVEVVASETQPRLFSAVVASFFSSDPETTVTMSARAVGVVEPGAGDTVACVLALSPRASGALTVTGSSNLNLDGCDVASNSNAVDSLYLGSPVTTGCAYAVGEADTPIEPTLTQCSDVKEYAPIVRDPYEDVAAPASWSNCSNSNQGHPTNPSPNLTPTCFTNGLTVKGELHFEPGLYIIDGGKFTVNSGDNAKLTGEGVTFYLANDAVLDIGSKIQMNFSAPGPGEPYAGILFFGDREATSVTHKLTGNPDSEYTGAIYTPASGITFAGNSKSTGDGCTQVIGNTVTFTGNSTMQSDCGGAGTSNIATGEVVRLIE